MMPVKKLLCCVLLGLLAVTAAFLCIRAAGLVQPLREELARTPTPDPVIGNVMQITPDPAAPTQPPLLKTGSAGEAVTHLQKRLTELGYYSGEVDGRFGQGTQTAVLAFQQQNSLDADGIAGAATLTLLYSSEALGAAITPTPEPTQASTSTPVPEETTEVLPVAAVSRKPYVRPDGLPLLVNREHLLPADYQPCDLVVMNDYCPADVVRIKYKNTQAEREAVDALIVMLRDAIAQGIDNWQISAAYRDEAYQQRLFDNQVNAFMKDNGLSRAKAIQATRKTVADPGTSEHHIGTSFDITVPGVSFKGTRQADWLAEHCWDYGFILRYTKEKESVTGFLAEAWHFRWVGLEHAQIMRRENLCLEEYLDRYGLEIEDTFD